MRDLFMGREIETSPIPEDDWAMEDFLRDRFTFDEEPDPIEEDQSEEDYRRWLRAEIADSKEI